MDIIARAAFINAQAACAQIEAVSMQMQNHMDAEAGRPYSYQPYDIDALINKYGLGHNDVITYLQEDY